MQTNRNCVNQLTVPAISHCNFYGFEAKLKKKNTKWVTMLSDIIYESAWGKVHNENEKFVGNNRLEINYNSEFYWMY